MRQLVVAGVHDVAGEREDARAGRVLDAELRVLRAAHLEHRRHGRDRLDVVHGGRRRVEARDRRERRLRPRLAALPLERLEERRLLAADVCARAAVDHDRDVSEEIALAHRLERVAQDLELALVLAADVDEDVLRLDPVRGDEAALEEAERDAQHDLAVLERPGLRLVGVDDEVVRLLELLGLGHERPLAPGREEGAAAAAQARRVELGDHVVRRHRAGLAQRREPARRDVVVDARDSAAVRAGEDDTLVLRHRAAPRRSPGRRRPARAGGAGCRSRPRSPSRSRRGTRSCRA